MTETGQNFTMYAGDYRDDITFTIADITDEDSVSAINWEAERHGGTHVIAKTLIDGLSMSDATGALVVTLTLDEEDTEGYDGVYEHELEVVDNSSHPRTVTRGVMTVEPALIVPVVPTP